MALGMPTSSTATLSDAMPYPGHQPFSPVRSSRPPSPLKRPANQAHLLPGPAPYKQSSALRVPDATTLYASGGTARRTGAGLRKRRSRDTPTGCATSRGHRTLVSPARTWRLRLKIVRSSYGRRTDLRSRGLRPRWTHRRWRRLPLLARLRLRGLRMLHLASSLMLFGVYPGVWQAIF